MNCETSKISIITVFDSYLDLKWIDWFIDCLNIQKIKKQKIAHNEADQLISSVDDIEVEFLHTFSDNKVSSYNKLLAEASGTHICIIEPYVLISAGSIREMLNYSCLIDKCGLVLLADMEHDYPYSYLNDKDFNMIPVICGNLFFEGVCFFDKEYLSLVGGLDKESEKEFDNYIQRFELSGLNNICLPNNFLINLKQKEYVRSSKDQELISEMRQRKSYYIPVR